MDTFKPTLKQRARLLLVQPLAALTKSTIPNYTLYGGATITGAHDAVGKEYTVCCAKDNRTGQFGLMGYADDIPVLNMPVSGRGSVWISLFDGYAYWKGWEGAQKFGARIPGFVPFTPLPALETELGNVAAQVAALAQATGTPLKSTVILAPDDPLLQSADAAVRRVVDVLEYYGWVERGA